MNGNLLEKELKEQVAYNAQAIADTKHWMKQIIHQVVYITEMFQ